MLIRSINRIRIAASAFIVVLSLLLGCIFGPEEKKEQKKANETPQCKPLTAKENVISNLLIAYGTANIDCYTELLDSQYVWRNQDRDITMNHLPEFVSREDDIRMTTNIFLAAQKKEHAGPQGYIDKLELKINTGSWDTLTTFQGNPCEDCWETTRAYMLMVVIDKGNTTLYAEDLVKFTIVCVKKDGKKLCKLMRLDDIAR